MKIDAIDALKLAAVLAVGVLAYRAARSVSTAASEAWDTATQGAAQAVAEVQQWFGNAFSAPASGGDPVKALLYSDYYYTGIDPATGESVLDGQWYGDEQARRYEYELRAAAAARGGQGAPAATSSNGAAFGIYPKLRR